MPVTAVSRLILALAVTAAVVVPVAAETVVVDETALRYYASRNETKRVEAEIRRLRALYPDWVVPDTLALPDAGNPEQDLWDLYAADDLDGLAVAIEKRKAADAAFTLSDDLATKIALKTARRDLLAAAAAGDEGAVLAAAKAAPDLGGCADLEVAWTIAAARADGGDRTGAEADYRALLAACTDGDGRRATVLKAVDRLGAVAGRRLAALGTTGPDGTAEFADLAPVFSRAIVTAALADPAADRPSDADIAALEAGGTADDLLLLGWWRRHLADPAAALAAFDRGERLLPAGDPRLAKVVEGRILSLDDLGRRDEAVATARAHRGRSAEIRRLFVDFGAARFDGAPRPVRDAGEIADYAAATEEARSAVGATALGWYALAFGSAELARQWFTTALGYEPAEDAAKGVVLAAVAAKDVAGAKALKSEWGPRFPAVAELAINAAAPAKAAGRPPIFAAYDRKDYRACLGHAERAGSRLPADVALIKGWCLLKLDRPVEAEAAFTAALKGNRRVREDAVYGRSLALLAAGRPEEAAAVATAIAAKPERRNEIGVAVLADRAIALFNARRYRDSLAILDQRARFAAETVDLTLLRGWALYHLGLRQDARTLFEALDRTLSTRQTRAALARLEG